MNTITSNIFICRINPSSIRMLVKGPRHNGDTLQQEHGGATMGQANDPDAFLCPWTHQKKLSVLTVG